MAKYTSVVPSKQSIRHIVDKGFDMFPGSRERIAEYIASRVELYLHGVDLSTEDDKVDLIINYVAGLFNVLGSDIKGRNQKREIADPRFVCMHIFYSVAGLSNAATGWKFSGLDHSTVIHGRAQFQLLYNRDKSYKHKADKAIIFAENILFNDNNTEKTEDQAGA